MTRKSYVFFSPCLLRVKFLEGPDHPPPGAWDGIGSSAGWLSGASDLVVDVTTTKRPLLHRFARCRATRSCPWPISWRGRMSGPAPLPRMRSNYAVGRLARRKSGRMSTRLGRRRNTTDTVIVTSHFPVAMEVKTCRSREPPQLKNKITGLVMWPCQHITDSRLKKGPCASQALGIGHHQIRTRLSSTPFQMPRLCSSGTRLFP